MMKIDSDNTRPNNSLDGFANPQAKGDSVGFWRSQSKIDTAILDILARVDKQEPEWWGIGVKGYGPPNSGDGAVLQWALDNSGPWAIMLKFVQETDDGLLRTEVT